VTICRNAGAALAVLAAVVLAPPRPVSGLQAELERPVILAVGESTTAGYGVPRELSYPAQLQKALDERGLHYRVVNQGVSGSTTAAALTRLSRGMGLLPKIVIIALGGNDGGSRVPIAATRANLAKLISMYKRVGAEVFVADRNLPGGNGFVAELAREHHAVLMPPLLTGVSGHPELLLGDGSHPNAEGYTIIVGNILPILEPYLVRTTAGR
jgi:acyl-CoA thioesterase-1